MSIKDVSPVDLSYIAGLIDADGWVCLARTKVTRHGRGRWGKHRAADTYYPLYQFKVGVVNRCLEVLMWAQSIFGGVVLPRHVSRRSPHAKNWSETYDWRMHSENLDEFLEAVEPYMRIKKRQVAILREYRKGIIPATVVGRQYRRTAEEEARRETLYFEMRKLNQAGLIAVEPKSVRVN